MMTSMSYDRLVADERGPDLRAALLGALGRTYTENAERYDPEGIGDDATWFGLSVSRNLWHIAEAMTQEISGVEARRSSNTFFLEIDGTYELYFCKAPPGSTSAQAVSFDSHIRGRIVTSNGSHLQMRMDLDGESTRVITEDELPHYAVIVHFGDPDDGFARAVIGAPYLLPDGEFGWEWLEPFDADEGHEFGGSRRIDPQPKPSPSDFGLVLRDEDDAAAQS